MRCGCELSVQGTLILGSRVPNFAKFVRLGQRARRYIYIPICPVPFCAYIRHEVRFSQDASKDKAGSYSTVTFW